MKKYVPLIYILGMLGLFLIIPITVIFLIIFIVGINDLTSAICMFLGLLVIIGPFIYIKNEDNASIVIRNNTLTNYINDGTLNFGLTEEINKIQKIVLVDNAELKKYFKNCKAKKALLIDFGSYNIKYISLSLFTKNQIKQILKDLKK